MTVTQVCTRCNTEKDISNFYPRKGKCKECLWITQYQYRNDPRYKEKILEKNRLRWLKNKDRVNKIRNQRNKEKTKSLEHIQLMQIKKLERDLKRKQKLLDTANERLAKKRESRRRSRIKSRSTAEGKIHHNLSSCLLKYLKNKNVSKNGRKWETILGYTTEQLKQHLESKFKPGMTWENYGSYWHIDHIKPKSWFEVSSIEDPKLLECWSLNNLQPLEASINCSKCDRYEG